MPAKNVGACVSPPGSPSDPVTSSTDQSAANNALDRYRVTYADPPRGKNSKPITTRPRTTRTTYVGLDTGAKVLDETRSSMRTDGRSYAHGWGGKVDDHSAMASPHLRSASPPSPEDESSWCAIHRR